MALMELNTEQQSQGILQYSYDSHCAIAQKRQQNSLGS